MKTESYELPAIIKKAVNNEQIAVTAKPCIGPHTNASIIVISDRDKIVELTDCYLELNRNTKAVMLTSISKCVREALLIPTEPNLNQDLMDDILILMSVSLIVRSEKLLTESGLFSLNLWIDPNEELPWNQRGMLDPKLMEKLNVPTHVIKQL